MAGRKKKRREMTKRDCATVIILLLSIRPLFADFIIFTPNQLQLGIRVVLWFIEKPVNLKDPFFFHWLQCVFGPIEMNKVRIENSET